MGGDLIELVRSTSTNNKCNGNTVGACPQKLEFRSFESRWGNKTSVSAPGVHILAITDPLPDRCVYDPLLHSLERAVKRALCDIHVDEAFTSQSTTPTRCCIVFGELGARFLGENMAHESRVDPS